MKSDSISVSSKIKEIINLHKSGILNDEKYHDLLKSQIISQLDARPLKKLDTEKESMKVSKGNISHSSRIIKKDKYDLLKPDTIHIGEVQPIKENVEKILWTLLK
jgi:hypothetical protein